ncbi:mevalonate kinase [Aeropyrum pernix]|uniref:Mevalonate kinase n=1 Tax=Aeropyrum pernix TaxID=56636 RepID=A0A401HBP3_AERPX|nr:mevalonate kinase [Aeropyrum pernix]GBF09824.1 mevalonate kinase [Aeropyrum pernix]
MMRAARASAPGKVIIVGEHFVVRGSLAIVAAIGRRLRVTVRSGGKGIVLESSMLGRHSAPLPGQGAEAKVSPVLEPYIAVLRSLAARGYSVVPHTILVESSIPPRAGLGSSAASMVAYALSYSAMHGDPLSAEDLYSVAMEGEKIAHGKPSGVDVTIAVRGGVLAYRMGENPVDIRPGLTGVTLLVADTGVERRTRDVVEHVLSIADALGEASTHIYKAADLIAREALHAIEKGDAEGLGLMMNAAQGLLSSLGASSLEIETLVYRMRSAGALGAKLTGAGWGGCVIGLFKEGQVERGLEAVAESSSQAFTAPIAEEGARLEES